MLMISAATCNSRSVLSVLCIYFCCFISIDLKPKKSKLACFAVSFEIIRFTEMFIARSSMILMNFIQILFDLLP